MPGPGDINKKRRAAKDTGRVISVSVEPDGAGPQAEVWMSAYTTQFAIAHLAGAAVRMKKCVLARLEVA